MENQEKDLGQCTEATKLKFTHIQAFQNGSHFVVFHTMPLMEIMHFAASGENKIWPKIIEIAAYW